MLIFILFVCFLFGLMISNDVLTVGIKNTTTRHTFCPPM